jgi:hypothetical protein
MSQLLVYYQNVRGLRSKTKEFFLSMLNDDHDVICLTETWLKEGVESSELFGGNYWVFRRDREKDKTSSKSGGGGSIIAIKKSAVACSPIHQIEWQNGVIEDVWVTLLFDKIKLHINCVYLEPACPTEKLKAYLKNVEMIRNRNPDDLFLVVGDFNLPN